MKADEDAVDREAAAKRAFSNAEQTDRLEQIKSQLALATADKDRDKVAREREELDLLNQQIAAIKQFTAAKQEARAGLLSQLATDKNPDGSTNWAAAMKDQQASQTVARELAALDKDRTEAEIRRTQILRDQLPLYDRIKNSIQEQLNKIGTVRDIMARFAATAIQAPFAGLQSSIAGLINKTMTWRDALLNIASQFVNSMVNAFAQMAAEYIEKKLMMSAFDEVIAAKGLALSILSAGKSLIAWLPSAIAASISSFGVAAALGTAAAVAAIVGVSGGFETGGYTGSGDPKKAAGIVHHEEVVFSRQNIAALGGVGAVERIRTGGQSALMESLIQSMPLRAAPASSVVNNLIRPNSPAAVRPNISVNANPTVVFFDDKDKMEKFLRSTKGQAVIYDLQSKNRSALGQPT